MPPGQSSDDPGLPPLPVEVELYIQPDGSVVFADLAAELLPLAFSLDPHARIACDLDPHSQQDESHESASNHE